VLVIVIAYPLILCSPNLALIAPLLATVVTLLAPRILDKILDLVFGKETTPKPPLDVEKLGKLIINESRKDTRRQELKNLLRTHYDQLIDEVIVRWFERQSLSINPGVRVEYEISLAKAICGDKTFYEDKEITTIGLREPFHRNQRIVDKAVKHLECYSEVWNIWSNAKTEVENNLAEVKELWRDLKNSLTMTLQMTEWHGYGPQPDDYYNLRLTFSCLWVCVQDDRLLADLLITTTEDGYYRVIDLARSRTNRKTIEDFIQVIRDLATDQGIQDRMRNIFSEKARIERTLDKFQRSLITISDDVKRRGEPLRCSCPTCKHLLDELSSLGA